MRERIYTIELVARRRWWVTPYTYLLSGLCVLRGTAPDYDKAGKFLAKRGFKYEPELKEVEDLPHGD